MRRHAISASRRVLPASRRAAKGWKRLSPQTSRMPVPWVLVCALENALLTDGCRDGALLMLPPVAVGGSQAVGPGSHPDGERTSARLMVAAPTFGRARCLQQDPGVRRVLADRLSDGHLPRQRDHKACGLDCAARRLPLPERMYLCMYRMRHSGAPHDCGSKQMTLDHWDTGRIPRLCHVCGLEYLGNRRCIDPRCLRFLGSRSWLALEGIPVAGVDRGPDAYVHVGTRRSMLLPTGWELWLDGAGAPSWLAQGRPGAALIVPGGGGGVLWQASSPPCGSLRRAKPSPERGTTHRALPRCARRSTS